MSAPDVDLAILGGGCAGLSLAARLAQTNISLRVIEPRTYYTNDRTWSFWRTRTDPFEDCVRKEWTSWTVEGVTGQTRRTSAKLSYQTVEAGLFYTRARELIDGGNNAALALGVTANDVRRVDNGWQIETDAGAFTAANVVDTRPPVRVPTYGQFFLGREIRTENPIFDPTTVQLMHFRHGHSAGVDFVYILPFARDQALIEVTSFAPHSPGVKIFISWLDAEIEALGAGQIEILRTEAGALPMQTGFADAGPDGITRMGLGGGAARPSTGYAFSRIQMQSDQVALALINGRQPKTTLDSPITRFMDRVFLQVLANSPASGPAMFETLFRKVPRDRLEQFLSGSTRTIDRLSVMKALPSRPFLHAAVRPV